MRIILDVSPAYAVVANAKSAKYFLPSLELATQVMAPDLFYSEATNVAWKYTAITWHFPNKKELPF